VPSDSNAPRVVPTELCLGGRDLTGPVVSPDGSTVAVVSKAPGEPAELLLIPAFGGDERTLTFPDEPSGGRGMFGGCLAWSRDGRRLAVIARAGLWVVDLNGSSALLLPADGSSIAAPVWDTSGGVVVAVDAERVLRVAADGRSLQPVIERLDDGGHDFVADPEVWGDGPDARIVWQAWSVPDMPWDGSSIVVATADGPVDIGRRPVAMQQPRSLADGSLACLRDDSGWLNLWRARDPFGAWEHLVDEPLEHGGPSWGPGQRSFVGSPDGTQIAFTRNEGGFGRLCVLEISSGEVVELGRGVHGHLSWGGNTLVAIRSGARTPTQVVAYSMPSGERAVLAVGPLEEWRGHDLPEPEVHRVAGVDGVAVPLRRYRSGRGRVLIMVHGGPTDQWPVTFLPRIARWWSEGWDVVVCDPRGSTGHGRAYTDALRGGWGRLDTDDVLAVAEHCQSSGWSTRDTTVVMGSSSGGLVVLNALIGAGPIVAGIALYPVSDLVGLAEHTHRFEAHYTDGLVGPPGSDALVANSPISRAAEISGHLLVMHGTEDPVVPIEHTRRLAAALDPARVEARIVELEGEGHGFRSPENRRLEYDLVGEFLAGVIGRASGLDQDAQ